MIYKLLSKFNILISSLAITVVAVLSSLVVYSILASVLNHYSHNGLKIATIIPAIVAPVISFFVLRIVRRLDTLDEALLKSETTEKAILNATTDMVMLLELDGTIVACNERLSSFAGCEPKELVGKKADEFIPPNVADIREKKAEEVIRTRRYVEFQDEVAGMKFSNRFYPILDPQGRVTRIVVFERDDTERLKADQEKKQLEAQLRQAQKLEAIGTLSGGIAHDFNNLLMSIMGNISLLLMRIEPHRPEFAKLKSIEETVIKGADLTKQLLGFSRSGKFHIKPINMNELVKKTSHMFGRTKKELKIHVKAQDNPWTVEVDPGQIEQVLLNLYVNAWQAMPNGGRLYIQTENVMLGPTEVKAFNIEPGKYVKTSVNDTGSGIDKKVQERIFDPFFTTKEVGQGTGLGLASSYGIIRNHNGMIDVYSEKEKGTTFNFFLPVTEKKIEQEQKILSEILRGNETILLVDDEEMIIEVAEELLQELGYNVLIARSGEEAVNIFAGSHNEIDLVILDMVMPDSSCGDTYDRFKKINANVKVLLASGYSIDGRAIDIMEQGCDGFMQKPFNIQELSYILRTILDKNET